MIKRALYGLLLVAMIQSPPSLSGQQILHASVTPSFRWPVSREAMAAANRSPKAQVQAFFSAVQQQIAGGTGGAESLALDQFRFAPLGEGKVCLAATAGERFPGLLEIICPSKGGFMVTHLMDERMGLLVTDLIDLDGDGFDEVISSEFAAGYQGASTPPIYWYTIYGFQDGLPHDLGRQFRSFYEVNVLRWGAVLERLIMPPLGSDSKENDYIEAQIIFTRLKYQRKILGETKAGLQEATQWAASPEAGVQELAVTTLREIDDPASMSVLKELANSKYQGVCRSAVSALAAFAHREVTGQEVESKCKAQ